MNSDASSILFLFPHPAERTVQGVERGEQPSERLYGLPELRRRGWQIRICDSRFHGFAARWRGKLRRHGLYPIDWGTIRAIAASDLVVVKDAFSTTATLAARLLGKKIIYLDTMFALPERRWRLAFLSLNLRLATLVICYSDIQRRIWLKRFGLPDDAIVNIPYGIDTSFYRRPVPRTSPGAPYVLSVGRDMGRDYETLVKAMEGLGVKLRLVTLPYLLPAGAVQSPWIEVISDASYKELFEMYAGACAAVVPLQAGITYPSGIRAALEAVALGTPAIVTHTPILAESLDRNPAVTFVDPSDVDGMRQVIVAAVHRWKEQISPGQAVPPVTDVEASAAALESIFTELGMRRAS